MNPSTLKRWSARAVIAVLGLLLLIPNTVSAQAAPTPAASSIAVLMKSYDANNGLIDTKGWWTSAVSLSTVETYEQTTGDRSYDYAITGAYAKHSNFTNDYIDDTGWWALAWLQAYDLTGNTNYLNMAKTTTNYMHNYWDSTCGGGVYWSTAKQYKASIANELFLAATAGLHNRIAGDTTYGGWATSEWNWFKNSGLISGNLVRDGLNVPNCTLSTANYSYNQGVILQGLAEQSRATGDTSLLTTATSIATAAVARFNHNGVLYDGCEPNCTGDGSAFKGIFARYLRALATAAKTTQYDSFLTTTANSIVANDTNSSGQQGNSFIGPFALWTPTTQASAAEALVAALGGSGTPPATRTGAITSDNAGKCIDDNAASTADGSHVQIWTCNNSGAQQVTVASDGTLQILGKCLDVAFGGTGNNTLVQLWGCDGTGSQKWTYNSATKALVNPQSGRCLDIPNSSTTDGTQLQIFDCNNTNAQRWNLPS
ncbi:glycoside hydrolase family 76 protein [Streptomyces sp. V4-01]|uniref:Glycoside hydrolase family 76 protein n=1 Tax=Actinacidiphila polyblastidii TaxID=3110430 RepID=A0ABU7PCW6_9ACTN|nr:glycoside hydrolase family 76 protein [Streptomyces sp. V4-01]